MACPTPEKRSFIDRDQAKKFLKASGHKGMHVYKCSCTRYHTTKVPPHIHALKDKKESDLMFANKFKKLLK